MKKKWIAVLAGLACCAVAFTGCTSVESGTVINRRHENAYDSTYYHRIGRFMVPDTIHHEEKYQLELQDTINGKVKTDWITVPEETYNQYQVSDQYP